MNAPVTRRALLGATAAIGAMSLPAVAEAGAPVSISEQPDAELFRLLEAWGPARAAADDAEERANALWDAFIAQEPPRPDALRYRGDDGLNCGFEVEDLPGGRRAVFYGLEEIGKLMSSPLPTRCEETYTPHPQIPGDQIVHRTWVPDERRIARRAEVIEAHHAWMAQGQIIKERLGTEEADEAEEAAVVALHDLERAILATAPATFAGLAVKARWASWSGLPKHTAEVWAKQVTADVVAMAERGRVVS